MGKFFDKKNDNAKPEDFVLMSNENSENCGTRRTSHTHSSSNRLTRPIRKSKQTMFRNPADAEPATEDAQDDGDVSQDTALINVAEVSRSLDKKKKFNKTTFIEYIKTHRTTTIAYARF